VYAVKQSLSEIYNNCITYETLCNWMLSSKWKEEKCSYTITARREKLYVACKDVYIVTYNLILLKFVRWNAEEVKWIYGLKKLLAYQEVTVLK